MPAESANVLYCPRCDRPYASTTELGETLERLKEHVSEQHPDHPPEWHETSPEFLPGETR